jgi:hypothetical protein
MARRSIEIHYSSWNTKIAYHTYFISMNHPFFYEEDRVVLVAKLLYEPHEAESILPIIVDMSSCHLEDRGFGA